MTQGHEEADTRRCPRCGGLMKKPANSSFFWHAENNHSRCDITNIVDTAPLAVQTSDGTNDIASVPSAPPPAEPPRGKTRKNKGA
ncbi:MAG TPA: hypothetical protein VKU38_16750 [Ktedonobacteraceae bacterium]|nr:hypothetical protein [Ktedonobacteraceae bacterium]